MTELELITEEETFLKENIESLEEDLKSAKFDKVKNILRQDILDSEKRLELCESIKNKLKTLEILKTRDVFYQDKDNQKTMCIYVDFEDIKDFELVERVLEND